MSIQWQWNVFSLIYFGKLYDLPGMRDSVYDRKFWVVYSTRIFSIKTLGLKMLVFHMKHAYHAHFDPGKSHLTHWHTEFPETYPKAKVIYICGAPRKESVSYSFFFRDNYHIFPVSFQSPKVCSYISRRFWDGNNNKRSYIVNEIIFIGLRVKYCSARTLLVNIPSQPSEMIY